VDVLDTLAAAYAEAGDFDRAVEMAQTAVQLAKKDVPASVQREIAARLALYEGRRPYREASASPATMRTAR
jgi:hypothetical protein